MLSQMAGIDAGQVKAVFKTLDLFVYGYASMLANNEMEHEEKVIRESLKTYYTAL